MLSEASRLLLKLKSTDEYCYILFSAFNKIAEEPYFGGFLRTGVQSKSLFADDAEKAHLGRLGYEPGTYGEIVLGTDIAKVDDTVWSVSSRVGYRADKNWDWYTQNDSGSHIAFREYFLNVKGFFDFDKDANIRTTEIYTHVDTEKLIENYAKFHPLYKEDLDDDK